MQSQNDFWYTDSCSPVLSDEDRWQRDEHRRTVHLADINGDGKAELIARSSAGISVWTWDTRDDCWKALDSPDPRPLSAGDWSQPACYETIQCADINGDGKAELIARASDGLLAYSWTNKGWEALKSRKRPLKDKYRWNRPRHYKTLHLVDINGDKRAELIVRSELGIQLWAWAKDKSGWIRIGGSAGFADTDGWDKECRYLSFRSADINGDGMTELIARTERGILAWAWRLKDDQYTLESLSGPGPCPLSAEQYNEEPYYRTISLADINGDGRAELIARTDDPTAPGGARLCAWQWQSDGWIELGDRITPFESSSDWDNQAYYSSLQFVDIDGDGRAELVVRRSDGLFFFRTGQPQWQLISSIPVLVDGKESPDENICFADVDGDRRPELIVRGPGGIYTGPASNHSRWLLDFTSSDSTSQLGDGRPWGDGTAISARAPRGGKPWDHGNTVIPMVGGDTTMNAIRDSFERAIVDRNRDGGHVYIAGWQLNALRDMSPDPKPWTLQEPGSKAQTALGLICRMMSAGINVRVLLWMTTTLQSRKMQALAAEHWGLAAAVQDWNTQFGQPGTTPRGVVALDLRTAAPIAAALHQKMIVVRVGSVNEAFCGGVDLAFTRRDHGRAEGEIIGEGDWQSGDSMPARNWWDKLSNDGSHYPAFKDYDQSHQFSEDLPSEVYGTGPRHWHDQHLLLRGPIVATLERQFCERWIVQSRIYLFNRNSWVTGGDNQVQVTSQAAVLDASMKQLAPLPEPAPIPPNEGRSVVQMWRTIPLRSSRTTKPFVRGEFTVTAGVANAVNQASQLITIWDQYFWSVPLAMQLAARLRSLPNLHLLVVLPPHGNAGTSATEMWLRKRALNVLFQQLSESDRKRVAVCDMWATPRGASTTQGVGVYVHAKTQTYDENLLVCGSANMNRRSTLCDAELDCAVADVSVVRSHLANLYRSLTGQAWDTYEQGWLQRFWRELLKNSDRRSLVPDPFWAKMDGPWFTPNNVQIEATRPLVTEQFYEPTSVADATQKNGLGVELESCLCGLPGEPGVAGRLDQICFLLERCDSSPTLIDPWPCRRPNTWA